MAKRSLVNRPGDQSETLYHGRPDHRSTNGCTLCHVHATSRVGRAPPLASPPGVACVFPSARARTLYATFSFVSRCHADGVWVRVCTRVGCTCTYAPSFLPSFLRSLARSLARRFVHPSDGDVRANLDVARRFCFIRESSSSFVRTRALPSSRFCRRVLSLSKNRERRKKRERMREDNSNVPSVRQGSSPSLSTPRCSPSSSGASTHPTHLGHSHTSLRLSYRIAKKREGEPNEHAPVTVHYRFCTPHHPLFPSSFFVYARMYIVHSAELILRLDLYVSTFSNS